MTKNLKSFFDTCYFKIEGVLVSKIILLQLNYHKTLREGQQS